MKLLHVIAGMDPRTGGVGQAVRTMATGLTEIGWQNEIVCLDAPGASFLSEEKFIVYATGPGKGPWCYSKDLSIWLRNNLSKFDGVIVHGLWLYNGYATRKAIQQIKQEKKVNKFPKLFVMPHGMLDPYFQQAKGRKLKALRNWAFWKLTERKLISEAHGLLFTCLTELQLAHKSFSPYHPRREFVVGLGTEKPPTYSIEMKEAFAVKCNRSGEKPYLLFLSRIHEKKGVDVLIKAYKIILEKNPGMPELVIAGPGIETVYGKQIKKLVADLGLQNNIHFAGMLTGDAKWGAFYGCEAFILPSHQENFGIAVVEALACNKPVLISKQVNIWQEIKAAGGGLVGDSTEEGVVDLLSTWLQTSAHQKQSFGNGAAKAYESFFALKPAVTTLAKALKS